ncbi:hypothetical protein C0J52_17684 [Blattella germanica]|nr:hypothetical protein C0J52_17684 [Blattella germanica]
MIVRKVLESIRILGEEEEDGNRSRGSFQGEMMAPGTSSMLRARRRDVNVKPNRRLDRKSSRGQNDIKKLRRENEQLRREIWGLREEYDRLENLLGKAKGRSGQDDDDTDNGRTSVFCCPVYFEVEKCLQSENTVYPTKDYDAVLVAECPICKAQLISTPTAAFVHGTHKATGYTAQNQRKFFNFSASFIFKIQPPAPNLFLEQECNKRGFFSLLTIRTISC